MADKKPNVYNDLLDESLAYSVLNDYTNLSVSVRKKTTEMTIGDTGEVKELVNYIVTVRSLVWDSDAKARVERSNYMKFNTQEWLDFRAVICGIKE